MKKVFLLLAVLLCFTQISKLNAQAYLNFGLSPYAEEAYRAYVIAMGENSSDLTCDWVINGRAYYDVKGAFSPAILNCEAQISVIVKKNGLVLYKLEQYMSTTPVLPNPPGSGSGGGGSDDSDPSKPEPPFISLV